MNSFATLFRQWRYLFLLGALLLLLVVHPILAEFGILESLFDALFVVVMVMLVLVLTQDKVWMVISYCMCVPAATLSIGGHFLTSSARDASLFAGHVIAAVFFVLVTGKIIHSIFVSRQISLDSIFGAICGYLLLGIAWGLMFAMIYSTNSESFRLDDSIGRQLERGDSSTQVFMYYSFVTLTTVGYGEITPLSSTTRTLAWVEAMTGQLYLAVLIAGLIGALVATKRN